MWIFHLPRSVCRAKSYNCQDINEIYASDNHKKLTKDEDKAMHTLD